mmetsp:Transcript_117007/g.372433  ORF Transcript_117007/g.372433 Transcript_117007/m.372433 type:complete len:255 (+) Transcript_117007:1472-2236(+)
MSASVYLSKIAAATPSAGRLNTQQHWCAMIGSVACKMSLATVITASAPSAASSAPPPARGCFVAAVVVAAVVASGPAVARAARAAPRQLRLGWLASEPAASSMPAGATTAAPCPRRHHRARPPLLPHAPALGSPPPAPAPDSPAGPASPPPASAAAAPAPQLPPKSAGGQGSRSNAMARRSASEAGPKATSSTRKQGRTCSLSGSTHVSECRPGMRPFTLSNSCEMSRELLWERGCRYSCLPISTKHMNVAEAP